MRYSKKSIIRLSVFCSFVFFAIITVATNKTVSNDNNRVSQKYKIFQPVIEILLANGVDSTFIRAIIENPNTKFDEKYIKINVTGFLKKPDYTHHYNAFSVKKSKQFLEKYYDILEACETKYSVPKEVLVSVLWIETKHGNYLGKHHIPSVLFTTALVNQKKYIDLNLNQLKGLKKSKHELKKLKEKIYDRSKRKAKRVINDLISLSKIQREHSLDVENLYGSWAGAFGLSQFLPSSFLLWAVDGNGDDKIDLFDYHDAIFSVGNYLKVNGWGKTEKEQRKAVFHYNNSKDYVNAVLTLAKKISTKDSFLKPLDKQVN